MTSARERAVDTGLAIVETWRVENAKRTKPYKNYNAKGVARVSASTHALQRVSSASPVAPHMGDHRSPKGVLPPPESKRQQLPERQPDTLITALAGAVNSEHDLESRRGEVSVQVMEPGLLVPRRAGRK